MEINVQSKFKAIKFNSCHWHWPHKTMIIHEVELMFLWVYLSRIIQQQGPSLNILRNNLNRILKDNKKFWHFSYIHQTLKVFSIETRKTRKQFCQQYLYRLKSHDYPFTSYSKQTYSSSRVTCNDYTTVNPKLNNSL